MKFAHVFYESLRRAHLLLYFCFVFWPDFSYFYIFVNSLDSLLDQTLSTKNKCTKPKSSSVFGKDVNNTCAQFQGLSLRNGVDIWTFVRTKCKKNGIAS